MPAFQALYGTMDKADNHYRRYSKRELIIKLLEAGFTIKEQFYMNTIGIIGWYLNGKVLKRTLVPNTHYSLYNKVVPILSRMERRVRPPFGLSLVTIAETL